jgi:HEAT repeat protein
MTAAPPPPTPPPPLSQPPTLQAVTPLGIALARVLGDPYGAEVLTRLTQLARHIDDAFSRDGVAEAIDAVNTLIEVEARAPNPTVRGTYGVILGRTLTRAALARVAPYLMEPRRRGRASATLKRGGDAASGLLVQLITDAQTLGERMIYTEVLQAIPQGTDRLLSLLGSRSDWQLSRNIAELAGEARIDAAVPYLARLQDQSDDRVKRAALVAMAKIGSVATVEPLRTVLKSGAPELKALVAASIGGPQARPLTAPLASLADEEENPDVARALIRAIGRIGTPEAKQALERAAAQKTLFSRRGKVVKEAAEEVLKSFASATPA